MKHVWLTPIVLCAALCAQELRITGGPADDQVLQRGPNNAAEIRLSGTAAGADSRPVEARLMRKHIVVDGFDWNTVATVQAGQWSGQVKDVPTGGPYRLEVRIPGTQASAGVTGLLVGDLWVLSGQSNMQGVGDLVDVEQPHELVHNFDMADYWAVAEEPLHRLVDAVDPVHWPLNAQKQRQRYEGERLRKYIAERKKGAGLGLPFGVEMVRRTGVPIGLLSCAHGGTSMDQWDPALKDRGGESLYGSMLRRFRAAGGRVRGVLWYQGESDANPRAAPAFQKKFEHFVAAVREDVGQPDLPFYYVQIGRHISNSNAAEWNLVQESQRKAELTIPRSAMAATVDFSLDDGIHVGTQDLKRLGRRLARLACRDLFPYVNDHDQLQRGPRPVSAMFGNGVVRVVFSGVNRRLRSHGRISGFTIHNAQGEPVPMIYKARVDPEAGSVVLLYVGGKLPEGATLRYGFGKDPYCNLLDEEDMAAPVFGPLPIQ